MIFFITFLKTLIDLTLKVLRYIFKKLNKYSEKLDLTIELTDIIFVLSWLILLPILHWSDIQSIIIKILNNYTLSTVKKIEK